MTVIRGWRAEPLHLHPEHASRQLFRAGDTAVYHALAHGLCYLTSEAAT